MQTVKEIADKFGVDPIVAYGLLHFMAEKNFIDTGRAAKVAGKKGKPATTYNLNRSSIDRLHTYLLEHLGLTANAEIIACAVPKVNAAHEAIAP